MLSGTCFGRTISDEATAIQAIREAADPSAVVEAFASAVAVAPNDSKVMDAYVSRMVELGLPEMAFHQAQALATMEPQNGLAWAVVGYVDARRNDMADAATALEKAARYSPDNAFVQRAAGGFVAWSETDPGKAGLSARDTTELADVKSLLSGRPEFTTAYNEAKAGYAGAGQPGAPQQPAPGPQAEVAPETPAYPAYPDYAYDYPDYGTAVMPDDYDYTSYPYAWGPWWEPPGYFYGSLFFPIGPVFGFHHHDFFEHHDHGFDRGRFIARGGFSQHHESSHGAAGLRSPRAPYGGLHAWTRSPGFTARPGGRVSSRAFTPARSGHYPQMTHHPDVIVSPHYSQRNFGSFHSHSFAARPGMSHGFSGGAHMGGGGFHSGGGSSRGGGFGGGARGGGRR